MEKSTKATQMEALKVFPKKCEDADCFTIPFHLGRLWIPSVNVSAGKYHMRAW